jgi:hypothetical protein
MRRIDIGDRNVFRTDGFVGQLTWPFLNAKPWGYSDIPAFCMPTPAQLSAYTADSPLLRRRSKVATPIGNDDVVSVSFHQVNPVLSCRGDLALSVLALYNGFK